MKNILILFSFFCLLYSTSCQKEEIPQVLIPANKKPYYIANEGAFGFSNSSLSLFYADSNIIINQAFESINGRNPGDVMQSICIADDKIYLIINASNKIEIANANTIEEITTIPNIPLPRYMQTDEKGNGYISCWGENGVVKVLNINTNSIISTIQVGKGPEKMLSIQDHIVVCNSGGFINDSTISIIETATKKVVRSLVVGPNPTDLVQQEGDKIWVLCRGEITYGGGGQIIAERQAKLVEVDIITGQILQTEPIITGLHPAHLEISPDKKTLYFGGGYGTLGIYQFNISNHTTNAEAFISESFYGFNVNSQTGDIYCLEAPTFTAAGKLKVYNSSGILISSHKTGIGPNEVVFQ